MTKPFTFTPQDFPKQSPPDPDEFEVISETQADGTIHRGYRRIKPIERTPDPPSIDASDPSGMISIRIAGLEHLTMTIKELVEVLKKQ